MSTITLRKLLDSGMRLHGRMIDIVLDMPDGLEGDRAGSVLEEDLPYAPDWILDAPLTGIDARDQGRLRLSIGVAPPTRA
ncbi:hypothetical protein [Bifidobacterium simiarum]|uniref:hypothetical protein n=1 Tax=Bifidobacterium simiarum TaxID=2045441 RepID=UPI001BDDABB1|nr:hypothetical protein [Bifidobacterium simiarum]MBT1167269.1 hypothetical protein [Bifidobacterium simiarum]